MEIDFFIGFLLSRKKSLKKIRFFVYDFKNRPYNKWGEGGKGTIFFGIKRFNLERKRKKLFVGYSL